MIRKGRVRWVAKGDTMAQVSFIGELFGSAASLKVAFGLRWSLRLRTAIFAIKPSSVLQPDMEGPALEVSCVPPASAERA